MQGYLTNIEQETIKNRNFRKVLFTAKHHQLVVMSLKPGEDIGEEVHNVDQFIRVEQGRGVVEMDKKKSRIRDDSAFVIPAGTKHNVINTSKNADLKIYTVYSSPQQRTVRFTRRRRRLRKRRCDNSPMQGVGPCARKDVDRRTQYVSTVVPVLEQLRLRFYPPRPRG